VEDLEFRVGLEVIVGLKVFSVPNYLRLKIEEYLQMTLQTIEKIFAKCEY
jgi:hypothetical protein